MVTTVIRLLWLLPGQLLHLSFWSRPAPPSPATLMWCSAWDLEWSKELSRLGLLPLAGYGRQVLGREPDKECFRLLPKSIKSTMSTWGDSDSGGKAGWLMIEGLAVQSPLLPANCRCVVVCRRRVLTALPLSVCPMVTVTRSVAYHHQVWLRSEWIIDTHCNHFEHLEKRRQI